MDRLESDKVELYDGFFKQIMNKLEDMSKPVVVNESDICAKDDVTVTRSVLKTSHREQGSSERVDYIVTRGSIHLIMERSALSLLNIFDGLIVDGLKQIPYTKDLHFSVDYSGFRKPLHIVEACGGIEERIQGGDSGHDKYEVLGVLKKMSEQ